MARKKFPKNPHLVDIIELNNDAVAYMKLGEPQEAYNLLNEALDLLQLSASKQKAGVLPTKNGYGFQWRDVGLSSACALQSSKAVSSSAASSSAVYSSAQADESQGFFLFRKALTVQMPSKQNLLRETYCPFGLLWALNYNLGLTCHLLAIGKNDPIHRRNSFQEALQMYDFVLAYIEQQRPTLHFTILLMGVLNNKGFICQELGLDEDERGCFAILKGLLESTQRTNGNLGWWRHFHLNIVSLEQQRLFAAAA